MNEKILDRGLECQSFGTPEVGGGLKTILLTPDGAVESANGRFVVDAEGAAMMVESFDRQGVEIPVDFEHQTLGGPYSSPDGRAPAAGWVTKIWYEIGRGVSAFVRWNAKTREAIREGAYGYVSPVLIVRKSDLKAIGLHSVGLTNKPAIVGLARIAASTRLTDTERKPMADGTMMDASAMLGELAGLLKIEVKGDAAALVSAIHAKLKALLAADAVAIAQSVRTALGLREDADADLVAANISTLKARTADVAAIETELTALKVQVHNHELEDWLAPYSAKGVVGWGGNEAHRKADREMILRMASSNRADCETVLKQRLSFMPPQGRTNPPTGRQMAIIEAEREYHSDVGHQNATSLKAFVSQSLRDKGLPTLTEDEAVTLSV
jgi:phage I-like protein